MALLEDKIKEIRDLELRDILLREVKKLKNDKKFGLVFEEHIPELAALHNVPIRVGTFVAKKTGNLSDVYIVESIKNEKANVIKEENILERDIPITELVVVSRFGTPIYPALIPIANVERSKTLPYHTIIEADNYHALQLLEYIYAEKIDCIYIDPPYNTGAKDWKYNNRYVDNNDSWRHSKWLSMMSKRLNIAKRLLSPEGVIVCTIDDHEVSHLTMLLEEIFPERNLFSIIIEHNKRGRQGEDFARTHEYALFLTPKDKNVIQELKLNTVIGGETRNLRRTGNNSLRTARPNQFYPIYVNPDTFEITEVGESIPIDANRFYETKDGSIPVWPIDKQGVERNWHYGAERTKRELEIGKVYSQQMNYGIQIYYTLREKESKKRKTIWSDNPKWDSSTHGSELLTKILGKTNSFSYPKSIYAVKECLAAACGKKKDALILDFFAGSGTTLHATLLLNLEDGGQRNCILVTNNEVSIKESETLEQNGYQQGDLEWEKHGVCRSVTVPRCINVIVGKSSEGIDIISDLYTNRFYEKSIKRRFKKLSFINPQSMNNPSSRKELGSIIGKIPSNEIKNNIDYFVSENESHTTSILFNDLKMEEYLAALEGKDHIVDFYIVTTNNKIFNSLKHRISSMLNEIVTIEEEKRPMSMGFEANLQYFKLDFLDPDEVAMGVQFVGILPILWLQSGAKGAIPIYTGSEPFLASPLNSFAVLIDENFFPSFKEAISGRTNLTHVFLVTNSEVAFFEMQEEINMPSIMLYKDYLQNFTLNVKRS